MEKRKTDFGHWIQVIVEAVGSVLVLAVTIIIIMQVLFRYVLKIPFEWSEEFARILFIWIVWLGSIIGIPKASHMSIEFFRNRFFPKYVLYIQLAMDLLGIFFLLVVTVKGYSLAKLMAEEYYLTINISLDYVYASCVVGGSLMIFYMIFQVKSTLQQIISGKKTS